MAILKTETAKVKRALIARDGSVYFIRRMTTVGGCKGIYIPPRFAEALHWTRDTPLLMWVQSDTLCLRELDISDQFRRFTVLPPRGARPDEVPPDEEA